jgi:hypothetical protein
MHLLIAAEFVGREDVPRAAAVLADVLAAGDPALSAASHGALLLLVERAAGQPLKPIAEPFALALERAPGRSEGLVRALRLVSGERLPPDPRVWREWWRRGSADHATVPAPGGGDA